MPEFSSYVMVRFSEIAIKGAKTRRWLTSRLVSHIDFILKAYKIDDFEIIKEYSRIFVKSSNSIMVEELITSLVPGAVSTSVVVECSSELEEIKTCVRELFFNKLVEESSFSVKVKRTGSHPFTSVELGAMIGEFILENKEEKNLKVDLTNPDFTLNIEVRKEKAYLFDKTMKGLGGLPVGSQGKVLVLVSGDKEDISNILQLYKRGAVTLIYSIQNKLDKNFVESITHILNLQPQLKLKKIYFANHQFDSKKIVEYYNHNKCLGIGLSNAAFTKYEKEIPVSIPLFVPHLVSDVEEEEIDMILATTI